MSHWGVYWGVIGCLLGCTEVYWVCVVAARTPGVPGGATQAVTVKCQCEVCTGCPLGCGRVFTGCDWGVCSCSWNTWSAWWRDMSGRCE